jgi:hypothetical protein
MLQFGANFIPASRSSSACQSDLECWRRASGFWAVQRRSQRLRGRREPRSRHKFSGYTKTDGIPLVVAFRGGSGTKERGTRPRDGSHKLYGASCGVRLHTIPTPCLAWHRGSTSSGESANHSPFLRCSATWSPPPLPANSSRTLIPLATRGRTIHWVKCGSVKVRRGMVSRTSVSGPSSFFGVTKLRSVGGNARWSFSPGADDGHPVFSASYTLNSNRP